MNEQGYVVTDANHKTSVEGLYAAGDVCIKSLRQVAAAVGDGALAATELERYAARMQKKTGRKPKLQTLEKSVQKEKALQNQEGKSLFSEDIVNQLTSVFSKMERPLVLKLSLDNRPVSAELKAYMEELAALTDKLTVEVLENTVEKELPCVRVCLRNGTETGLAFHGMPGGHEFTSFVLGLYNASGPVQAIDENIAEKIAAIHKDIRMQIMTTDVYDLNHFPDLKDKYQVMSVSCLVINGEKMVFGKKNIEQLVELLAD